MGIYIGNNNLQGLSPSLTDQEAIALYRMATLRAALKLEVLGMKRRGRSVFAIVKEENNLKGTKRQVLDQFTKLYEERKLKYLKGESA